jgi:uncharacterized protein YecT (DUF1311 family)
VVCKELVVIAGKPLFLILALSSVAHAARATSDQQLSPQFSACMDKASATVDIRACDTAEAARQDARLNKAYQHLMTQLSPDRQKQLRDIQRIWIKFREGNCSFYNSPGGGTLDAVVADSCYLTTTASRASELEEFKEDY